MQSPSVAASASKRVPRACAECSRRKIRCDRMRPCRPCILRNQGRECLRISIDDSGSIADSPDIPTSSHEVAMLRERIAELETKLLGAVESNTDYRLDDEGISVSRHQNPISREFADDQIPRQDLEHLESAFEDVNLGLRGRAGTPTASFLSPRSPLSRQTAPIPSRHTSTKIVKFALSELGWIHCALRASEFLRDHEHFWTSLETFDYNVFTRHSWFALYYAVLAIGMYYMDLTDECFRDFLFLDPEAVQQAPRSIADSAALAKIWYRGSLQELELADFLGKSKLSTVQTIAILPLLTASFGETEREWLMMGAAINMARSLQMHKLRTERSIKSVSLQPEWSSAQARGLGRRLWWTLCICDWLGNMSRPTSIIPGDFNTEMELGVDDQDVILENSHSNGCTLTQISVLDYHFAMAKIASIVQQYVKTWKSTQSNDLALAMAAIENLYAAAPAHLRYQSSSTNDQDHMGCHHYKWTSFQSYLFTHTFEFLRLTIARSLINDWFQQRQDRHEFRKKAVEAAEVIVGEKTRTVPQMFRKSWIVCASTVAAGVILALDMLCFSAEADERVLHRRRESIRTCIEALESLQATNSISRGGPDVLRRLLSLEVGWDHARPKSKDILRKIMEEVTTRSDVIHQFSESLLPFTPIHALPSFAQPSINETPLTMEWTGTSPDAFDGIFASAISEIDMFENPFEFNESNLASDRRVM